MKYYELQNVKESNIFFNKKLYVNIINPILENFWSLTLLGNPRVLCCITSASKNGFFGTIINYLGRNQYHKSEFTKKFIKLF